MLHFMFCNIIKYLLLLYKLFLIDIRPFLSSKRFSVFKLINVKRNLLNFSKRQTFIYIRSNFLFGFKLYNRGGSRWRHRDITDNLVANVIVVMSQNSALMKVNIVNIYPNAFAIFFLLIKISVLPLWHNIRAALAKTP